MFGGRVRRANRGYNAGTLAEKEKHGEAVVGCEIRHNQTRFCGESAMKRIQQFTAIIEREENGYVSFCPKLHIASQGDPVEEVRNNLVEAIELFFEVTDPSEVAARIKSDVFITRLEVSVG
jgi:predicted RNase H-like HicB family nuclease